MKKVYAIIILVVFVANVAVVKYYHQRRTTTPFEYTVFSNVLIEERLERQVVALKTLSVEETVQLLSGMEYYLYPGAFIGGSTIFLRDADGNTIAESLYERDKIEVERILSNRVFRKSLQDLREMPKNQASNLLNRELGETLSKYLELYRAFYEARSLDFNVLSSSIDNISEAMDGNIHIIMEEPPVFFGLRKKLFALVLIAGSLELTDVHEKIKEIDVLAQKQKEESRCIEDMHIRRNYILSALLHNNLVLASGLYGTSSRKGDAALKPFSDRFVIHQIVDFSAPATEYDVMVRHDIVAPRPDEEYINVRYFEQMTNEDLDELRRILALP